MRRNHRAVRLFIELDAEVIEPLYRLGRIAHKLRQKLALRGIMPAA